MSATCEINPKIFFNRTEYSNKVPIIKAGNGSILKLYNKGFTLEDFTGLDIKKDILCTPYLPAKIKSWFLNSLG